MSDIPEDSDLKKELTGLSKKIAFIRLGDILNSPLSVISYQLSVIRSTQKFCAQNFCVEIRYHFDNRLPLDILEVQEYHCFEK